MEGKRGMMIAQLSTGYFDFLALGRDKNHAERVMIQMMKAHATQREINFAQFWREFNDGINYTELELGEGARDYSSLVTGVA